MARKHTPAPLPSDLIVSRLAVSFEGGWEVLIIPEDDEGNPDALRLVVARDPESTRRETVFRASDATSRNLLNHLRGTEWEVFYQPMRRVLGLD